MTVWITINLHSTYLFHTYTCCCCAEMRHNQTASWALPVYNYCAPVRCTIGHHFFNRLKKNLGIESNIQPWRRGESFALKRVGLTTFWTFIKRSQTIHFVHFIDWALPSLLPRLSFHTGVVDRPTLYIRSKQAQHSSVFVFSFTFYAVRTLTFMDICLRN